MTRLALLCVMVTSLAACGQSDASKTKDMLTGDATAAASENPMCKLFTPQEVAAYAGEPLSAGKNAGGGTGCQWSAASGEADVMVTTVPANYAEVPSGAPNFKQVADVGEQGFVVPELGGFAAGAVVGKDFVKVSAAGPGASADNVVVLLKEAIKRLGQPPAV